MVTRSFLIVLGVQWGQWGCTLDGYKGTMNSLQLRVGSRVIYAYSILSTNSRTGCG